MLKHLVQCEPCKKEVEASFAPSQPGSGFVAPYGWLTVNYSLVNKDGSYVTNEHRHACPDCAAKVVNVLDSVL